MMFRDEVAKKWYKLIDLFDGYDSLFDTNIPVADIDGVFTGNENT
jgi:hypothetical protein